MLPFHVKHGIRCTSTTGAHPLVPEVRRADRRRLPSLISTSGDAVCTVLSSPQGQDVSRETNAVSLCGWRDPGRHGAKKTSRGDHGLLTATARRRIHLGSTIAMGCPRQLENRTSVHFAAAHEWCGRSSPLFRDVSRETPPYGTATVRGVTASKPQRPAGPSVSPSCPLCGASGNVHAWLRHIQRRRKT